MRKLLVLTLAVLFLGTIGLAKTNKFDNLLITGDVTVEGTVEFGDLDIVGDLDVNGAEITLDGSTFVTGISAGYISFQADDIRLGFDAADYMKIAVATGTGDVTITHTGTNKAVSWTAAAGFTFAGGITDLGVVSAGTWQGTAVAVGYGGTGSANASDARIALGLIIGTDVQTQDDELNDIAGLTFADDQFILGTGAGTIGMTSCTIFAQSILDDADEATFKATVNLEAGADFNAYDAELAALAGLTFADDKIILGTGAGTIDTADCTVFAQSILDDADEATFKATVNLELGTDVQTQDTELEALAGLTSAANAIPYFTGSGTADVIGSSANMVALLGSADYATARTNLSLVPGTNVQTQDDELDDIAGLTFADDKIIIGTGAGTIDVTDCTVFAQSILDDADEATFKATVNLEIDTDVQAYHANLAALSIADNQPITEYVAFDIEEATMDGDDGSGIKVASVDVNATGLILAAFVNVTQGYSEASDTIELVINTTDDIATPVTTLVGATDTSAAHLLAYQPATGVTVLGATSTTNRYVVVGYKDVTDDGNTGANLQGTLIVIYLEQ